MDVRDCYNGDDVWMGPYQGADAHGGLDVNSSIGTPLWAPIDFDDQYLFNSLAAGHNNNRWRGIRRWPNGDVWALQTHHDARLLVPEHTPIKQGTHYAVAAGTFCGCFAHTHFVFKVGWGKDVFSYGKDEGVHDIAGGKDRILLDPWILFRQIFENNKQRAGAIRSSIAPFEPAETGRPVVMQSRSRPGVTGNRLSHYWTFGDGGWSDQPAPRHTYLKPGIYPVTLVVDDGTERATFTQHVTVDGEPVDSPGLALACPDQVTFRARPVDAMDVYGRPVQLIPHTLEFLARPSGRSKPAAKTITLGNVGTGELGEARFEILDGDNVGWLKVTRSGSGKQEVSWQATLRRWRKFDDDTTMQGLVELMKKHGVEKPLWVTEFGGHPAAHERSQGLGILRQAAILVAEGAKGLHYYEFYDYPHEPSRYQLVRHEDKYRTLGLVAYSQAIRYLTGASYEPDRCEVHSPGDSAADNLPYRVFGRGDETIICLWSNAATPAEVEIRTKEKCGAVHVATFCPQDAFLTETSLSPGGSTADGTTRIISDHRLTTVLYPLEFRILSLE